MSSPRSGRRRRPVDPADLSWAADRLLTGLALTVRDPDLGRDRLAAVPPDLIPAVASLARAHGLEAWLAGVAPAAWATTDTGAELAQQRVRFIAARARSRAELDRFAAVAEDLQMPWAAVKGQAIAESLYPRPQFRYGVDVDVLVPPARFASLAGALDQRGWRLVDVNWPLTADTGPGQLRYVSPTGGLFDVHWALMNNPTLRACFPLSTTEQLSRRTRLASGLWTLAPEDQLVHLAIHAALSGASRLVWLLDTGLAADQLTDWDRLCHAALLAGAGPAVSLVLLRAHRWLGTPAPPGALARMGAGPLWRSFARSVDRLSPLSGEPERPALSRSVARSVRSSAPASLAEFGRHASAFVRSGAPRHRPSSPLSDAHDPRSPLFPCPDEAARARYYEAVAAS